MKTIKTKDYVAEYNEDLDGFVITFNSGNVAQTQFSEVTDRLHADFGEKLIERYDEYDDLLSKEEDEMINLFVNDFDYSIFDMQNEIIEKNQETINKDNINK